MKKNFLFVVFTFLFLQSFAQTKGHFSFTWTMIEDGETTAMNVDVYISSQYFAITSFEEEMGTEKAIINRSAKKGIEFFSDIISETENDNYYANFNWDVSIEEASYVSDILSGVLEMPDFNNGFQLLSDKNTIAGLPCQKFKINLPNNEGTISGWIALGVHCLVVDEHSYLDTDKGMILEMSMAFDENTLEVKCTGYDSKFSETSTVYSMEIPEGYDSLEEEEYSDEENEEE